MVQVGTLGTEIFKNYCLYQQLYQLKTGKTVFDKEELKALIFPYVDPNLIYIGKTMQFRLEFLPENTAWKIKEHDGTIFLLRANWVGYFESLYKVYIKPAGEGVEYVFD